MTLDEAAEELGVHYMTVYRYVRTGRLAGEKLGAQWRVRRDDVEALAAEGPARRGKTGSGASRRPHRDAERLAGRLTAGDEGGSWQIIDDALASGHDLDTVLESIIGEAMRMIGDQWEAGTLDVGEEHVASALCLRILGRLGSRFTRRGRKRGTVILGAPPGDAHGLPLALVGDVLRGRGFRVVDMGANTPAASFSEAAVSTDGLMAVGICATTPDNEAGIRSAIKAVHKGTPGVQVVVGGSAVASDAEARALGADHWTATSRDLVEWLETF